MASNQPLSSGLASPTSGSVRLLVDRPVIGAIIGKGGAHIQELNNSTGAYIRIENADIYNSTERVCTVSGSLDSICEAVRQLTQTMLVAEQHASTTYPDFVSRPAPRMTNTIREHRIGIPNDAVGAVIGYKGANIALIKEATSCSTRISDPDPNYPNTRLVTITGPVATVETATKLVKAFVRRPRNSTSTLKITEVETSERT